MPSVIDDSSAAIGAIQSAMLTESQFQSQFGSGWVLADGRSVTGSRYASLTGFATIPDLRGVVLRGKNNARIDTGANPDGDLSLGAYQDDAFESHRHSLRTAVWHDDNNHSASDSVAAGDYTNGFSNSTATSVIQETGALETRMKNVTVNHFIRIN